MKYKCPAVPVGLEQHEMKIKNQNNGNKGPWDLFHKMCRSFVDRKLGRCHLLPDYISTIPNLTACAALLRLAHSSHWSARQYKVPQWGAVLRSRTAALFAPSLIVWTGCSGREDSLKVYLRLHLWCFASLVCNMKERRLTQPFVARCKLVLVGDVQCGKTAMLQVLAKDCYPEVSG